MIEQTDDYKKLIEEKKAEIARMRAAAKQAKVDAKSRNYAAKLAAKETARQQKLAARVPRIKVQLVQAELRKLREPINIDAVTATVLGILQATDVPMPAKRVRKSAGNNQ
jgi:hypothetical protein